MQIDWISLGIGIGATFIVFGLFNVIRARIRKKISLEGFKAKTKVAYDHLTQASERIRELHAAFLALEKNGNNKINTEL